MQVGARCHLHGANFHAVRFTRMFRRVIYTSRSLIGADPDALDAIVSTSIRRNAEADVTGMMWADVENFAQVIEGGAEVVARTMDRIRADRRHTDIVMVLDRAVSSRQFGSWSMRRAGHDDDSASGTSFMVGFALGEGTPAARRLYDIVLANG